MEQNKEQSTRFPQHIAVIMDGNRRWAKEHRLPRFEGHRAGLKSLRNIIEYLGKNGLKYLTVYGFSTENWNRSKEEVNSLLRLLQEVLGKEITEINKKGLRFRHLGRLEELPPGPRGVILKAVEATRNNTAMTFNFAFNYGGRSEILDAVRRLMTEGVKPEVLNEESFRQYLYTDGIPDVDLLIRTGGETRLSNFLMWQSAYSELYFTDVLWPDFDDKEIDKALLFYSQKQRRFGGD